MRECGSRTINTYLLKLQTAHAVLDNHYNGVDIYLLNIDEDSILSPSFAQWVIDLHVAIRNVLGICSSPIVVGCCWMLLDVVGCCWMLLDVVGCCWMLLDVVVVVVVVVIVCGWCSC
jgi:hypothetical protein